MTGEGRDVPGALYGSRLITLPHVAAEVAALKVFVAAGASVLVEIGFDHGRRLMATAREKPDWRVVGLEIRRRRVDAAKAHALRHGLDNLFIWRMDARTVFAGVLDDASVDIVEVLFPDPWWNANKRRKRLLIDDDFLADVCRVLRPGGLLHLATDVPRYAEVIDRCLQAQPALRAISVDEGSARRPACSQQSRRERKCAREGLPVQRRYAYLP